MDKHYIERTFTTIRDYFYRIGRIFYYLIGLLGIVSLSQIVLLIFYDLSYDYRLFYHLTHVQSTIVRFVLAGVVATFILRLATRVKRIIWWVWGTQTPDYQLNLDPQDAPNQDLVETARYKGGRWFWIGIIIAYFIALTGFYQIGFAEIIFVTGFPKIPILSDVLGYLAQFPLINNLVGLTEILPAQNAISYLLIGAVLVPLTLGLYNISYVLEHNRFIRKSVRSDPKQMTTIYFATIPFGILFLIFLMYAFLLL